MQPVQTYGLEEKALDRIPDYKLDATRTDVWVGSNYCYLFVHYCCDATRTDVWVGSFGVSHYGLNG